MGKFKTVYLLLFVSGFLLGNFLVGADSVQEKGQLSKQLLEPLLIRESYLAEIRVRRQAPEVFEDVNKDVLPEMGKEAPPSFMDAMVDTFQNVWRSIKKFGQQMWDGLLGILGFGDRSYQDDRAEVFVEYLGDQMPEIQSRLTQKPTFEAIDFDAANPMENEI